MNCWKPVSARPLAVFRIGFGAIMAVSLIRFWAKGWISSLYVEPKFHFPFFGWDWLEVLPGDGMYILFALLILSAICISLGIGYRISVIFFFIGFSYIELLDKTYYLNHCYFVSLVSFLLIFLPAHKEWSLLQKFKSQNFTIARWELGSIRLMLGMVYCFAGIAKWNADWVLRAMPLKLWLRGQSHLPFIGDFLTQDWVAYGFSFFGLFYDCTVPFFLLFKKTRKFAYLAVLAFHLACVPLFQIGMFPWMMIICTLVFFPFQTEPNQTTIQSVDQVSKGLKIKFYGFVLFFLIQLFLPFRYLLLEGPLFWTERGYRFSWRVMLIEKAGAMFYTVTGYQNGKLQGRSITNEDFLTPNQIKMVATQPDMLLDYAHLLEHEFKLEGWDSIQVFCESYVTLNGRRSSPFTKAEVNLLECSIHEPYSFLHQKNL